VRQRPPADVSEQQRWKITQRWTARPDEQAKGGHVLHKLRHLIIPGLLFAAAACAHHKVDTDPNPEPALADSPPVRVEVRNKYALPMEIYVVGGGSNQRLGTVYPGTVKAFVIPQAIANSGSAELQAHPSADARDVARSGPLMLSPGAVVDFVIGTQLFSSTATIRP
jgi:hypothetical protein